MKIAVDFDGTIVEDKFPKIGKEIPQAISVLKSLSFKHQIILWTCRKEKYLDEAVEYCEQKGLRFYAVNKNYPEETEEDLNPRKIDADIYIDDRNINTKIDWNQIYTRLK